MPRRRSQAATGVQSTPVKLPTCASWGELYPSCAFVWIQSASNYSAAAQCRYLCKGLCCGVLQAEHRLVASSWPQTMRQLLGPHSLLTAPAKRHKNQRRLLSQARCPHQEGAAMWVLPTVEVHWEVTDTLCVVKVLDCL